VKTLLPFFLKKYIMADPSLNILVVPTYNTYTLGVVDASVYPTGFVITSPSIQITPPGFDAVSMAFIPNEFTVYNSTTLGISEVTDTILPIPDGIYYFTYSISPAYTYSVEKSIMRVDRLQERFDEAFMKLDMMECDQAIKTQAKVDLNTIYFFIQGSIAAANNCAVIESSKLYETAYKMLNHFIANNCGCTGNNF
jgi:hypothetical protein